MAACVWDHAGDGGPLSLFWRAVQDIDPGAGDESGLAGSREGHLAELCRAAGLPDLESSSLTVRVGFATFADWWEPFTLGVGPAGAYVAGLDPEARSSLAGRCAAAAARPAVRGRRVGLGGHCAGVTTGSSGVGWPPSSSHCGTPSPNSAHPAGVASSRARR